MQEGTSPTRLKCHDSAAETRATEILIIALLKGVPARTTKVVTVGGVLRREEMEIVLNPHDSKAIEAADYVRRRVGGKTIALSMGPDIKLSPLIKPLYHAEVFGVDEAFILSDRKMAGADTLATSYAVSLGVRKVVERHVKPIEELVSTISSGAAVGPVSARAKELYTQNLLPNMVYSELPAVKDSIISQLSSGSVSASRAIELLEGVKSDYNRFIIVSGIKTTDGETGSVGPQVAESLSESMGVDFPHLTYVEDFEIDPETYVIEAERKIGRLVQKVELNCPALLTISPEYAPRPPDPSSQVSVRGNSFRGKTPTPMKWTADELSADPARLGLAGSPTIVGPGVDIGKPPVQKIIGKSIVFTRRVEKFSNGGADYGPYDPGDLAQALPEGVFADLMARGLLGTFTFEMLQQELFR
jgi:electron transfer flavoprotein beta subunit